MVELEICAYSYTTQQIRFQGKLTILFGSVQYVTRLVHSALVIDVMGLSFGTSLRAWISKYVFLGGTIVVERLSEDAFYKKLLLVKLLCPYQSFPSDMKEQT